MSERVVCGVHRVLYAVDVTLTCRLAPHPVGRRHVDTVHGVAWASGDA